MMHKEKYDVTPEQRTTLTEKLASYYGNLRTRLLGSYLAGRRSTYQLQDEGFPEDAQLTSFRQESKEEVQLKPKTVDLQRTLNRYAHKTSGYEIPNLIIRRGQAFEISIVFDRSFNETEDELTLKFVTGRQPLQSKGTVISVNKVHQLKTGQWGFQITSVEDKKVNLKVLSSSESIVGRYQLFVDTLHKNTEGDVEQCRYTHPDDIYLIFNPWCADDAVYLDDENQREEYVLNETGRIWMGTVGKFCVRPWNFAQFDDVCLVAALAIMEKSELGDPARCNPLLVVRALSRVINNNERDGGVLVGNWSGKYDDGVAPYAWNGSAAILEEFLKKRKGVKFGQCWTFAAVTTTVFRSLGIPTRCVTNFKSAHDSDYSTQIDNFWTTEGRPRKIMDDTIWDFHVWNESWFRRPDLPEGYDGWQAYDPTPQECYEGVFTCGPASVTAIRNAELYLGYDAKFLFAEVNGDRIHWKVDAEGNMTPIAKEDGIIGCYISTKAVNTISREDVTLSYKNKEGSQEFREAIEKANKLCCHKSTEVNQPSLADVDFKFVGEITKSGDINISLSLHNTSTDARVVDSYICVVSTKYTAVPSGDIKDTTATDVLEPQSDGEVKLNLKGSEYLPSIDPDSSAQIGKPFDVIVKLVNPLSIPLTGGYINLEGPGMQKPQALKVKKSIAPSEEIRETIQVKPRRAGRREVIASFQCKQLCDVTGVVEVDVSGDTKN
ncbi:hypothetical protein KUTeg_019151 [Tegillarca granosa]|uniref:Transglutaminase-like domain-containing protein n=1 Tax=Tegillarca granosa TaxID=220873 RepID=A0ABQ9EGU1_TEGGR|nr:hypothetical protein KUTeg_019151 [Tegillarca granosa]